LHDPSIPSERLSENESSVLPGSDNQRLHEYSQHSVFLLHRCHFASYEFRSSGFKIRARHGLGLGSTSALLRGKLCTDHVDHRSESHAAIELPQCSDFCDSPTSGILRNLEIRSGGYWILHSKGCGRNHELYRTFVYTQKLLQSKVPRMGAVE
jgi:hypothetical protein